jgi:hypothetical protein
LRQAGFTAGYETNDIDKLHEVLKGCNATIIKAAGHDGTRSIEFTDIDGNFLFVISKSSVESAPALEVREL